MNSASFKNKDRFLRMASAAVALFLVWEGANEVNAQTVINLAQDSTVRTSATYTYFARGDNTATTSSPYGAISPFSVAFYPQNVKDNSLTWNKSYTASDAGAVSLKTGLLTDNSTANSIAGVQFVNQYVSPDTTGQHNGAYDILFNLGSSYVITSVVLTYTDTAGARWTLTSGAQSVYYSLTAPTSDASLTLFSTATAVNNTTAGLMTFTPTSSVTAQYLDIRPSVKVSDSSSYPNASSIGGYLSEVAIYGYAVPEPTSLSYAGVSLLSLTLIGLCSRKRKTSR